MPNRKRLLSSDYTMKRRNRSMNIIEKFKLLISQNFLARQIVLAVSLLLILFIVVSVSLSLFTRHGQKYRVPNFAGMTIDEARKASSKLKLRLEVIDSVFVATKAKGIILEQYPKAGNFVKSGRRIFLTTNTFSPKMVPVPYVTGFSLRQAKNKIVGAGLVISKLTYKQDIATNNILGQRYKGKNITQNGTMGEIGSGVELIVGHNPADPDPIVPGLVGLTVDQARNRLWEAGFNVGSIDQDDNVNAENFKNSKVYSQSIEKNRPAMFGRSISFKITMDEKKVSNGVNAMNREAEAYQREQEALLQDSLNLSEQNIIPE